MPRRERLLWRSLTFGGVIAIVLILALRWNDRLDDGVAVPLALALTLLVAASVVTLGIRTAKARQRDE